ncbi:senescence-associated carboxylesterase 101-like protein [Tanacetum coccineum]
MSHNMFCSEVELGKFLCNLDIILEAFQAITESSPDYDAISSPFWGQIWLSHINTPLVVTGCGLGGYLAILSTLRLHQVVDEEEYNGNKKTKRPICITFGSPLIGDQALQSAISERPQWKPSFLNVVAKKDPVACYFSSRSLYKPLGISLFCTESGGHTAFEDQDSVMAVLDDMASSNAGNMEMHNYDNDLKSIRRKVLYRGVSELGEFNLNSLRAGITMQFKEVDVLVSSNLIMEGEKKQEKMIRLKRNVYEPTKKLNDSKIDLTYMEWYMKIRKSKGGYYDSYTNALGKDEIMSKTEAVKRKGRLNKYWVKIVEENNLMPQKVGSKLRKRWLYGGTNYRRIVEPLDIREFYKNGKKNYIDTKNRPEHYQLLEKWSNEDKKDSNSSGAKRNKAASLTEDSCFYAHVEEAFISLRDLKNGGSSNNKANMEQKLKEFEEKVMCAIKDYSLSTDVFVEGSSLLRWWSEYEEYKGSSYVSDFAEYMNKKSYKSYQ